MKNIVKYFFTGLIYLTTTFVFSQEKQDVSVLKRDLARTKSDTNKIEICYLLSIEYQNSSTDTSLLYMRKVLDLSRKIKFDRGISQAYHLNGVMKNRSGEYDSALYYFTLALKMDEEAGRKRELAASLDGVAQVYFYKSNFAKSLEYRFKALKLNQETGDQNGEATTLGNIGITHYMNNEYALALEYYNKAMTLDEKLNHPVSVARHLLNIATIYFRQGDEFRYKGQKKEADEKYKKSLELHFRSLNIVEKEKIVREMAMCIGGIGNVYYSLGDTLTTLEYYKKALALEMELDNKEGIARNLSNIGWVCLELKKYGEAEAYTKKAIAYADTIKALGLLYNCYENLSIIYESDGNDKLALKSYKKFISLRDSIYNIDNSRKALQAEMNYKFEQKEILAQQERVKQKIIRNSFIGGFALMFVLAIVILRGYRSKQKANHLISQQKELVDEKNKEITDSIQYAKRIQQSLLPTETYIERNLNKLQKD